jgi:HSP20 family protein
MKIQKGGTKIAPPAPSTSLVWEPYFERMKEFERAMLRFFTPFDGGEFEYAPFPFELRETEQGFAVSAALPGFKESEIEVRVEPWRLFVSAKHEEEAEPKKGQPVYKEHAYNRVTRWVEFPAEVNAEKVKATLEKGVLEVTLEKAETARKIEVHSKAA